MGRVKKKRLLPALLLVLLAMSLAAGYSLYTDRLGPVIDGLVYRSAQLSADKLQHVIDTYQIETVINLRGIHPKEEWFLREKETAAEKQVDLYNLGMPDHDLPSYHMLNRLVDVLQTAEKPILIHCRRGADRTGMASALTLAVERDVPLAQIKKQFSWRYGVIPLIGSIGPLLFSEYEAWLHDGRKWHSRSHLLYWIEHVYVDRQQNLEFWIDSVNGQLFERDKHYTLQLQNKSGRLYFRGWGYDAQTQTWPRNFMLNVGKRFSLPVEFKFRRPDVEMFLNLDHGNENKLLLGWETSMNSQELTGSCYPVSVSFEREKTQALTVSTSYELCLE